MAVQPNPFIAITDGTTTVTIADGAGGLTNYPLVSSSWAPNVAGLRESLMGGRGPYADVTETLTINIRDTTAALCYSRLDTLARLLDQADRWWSRGDNVSPVLFQIAPQGSTIAATASPFQAVILGPASKNETSAVNLPVVYDKAGMIFEIRNVKLSFIRRGQWLGPTIDTATSGSAQYPTVHTCTLTTHPTLSPLQLKANLPAATNPAGDTAKSSYILTAAQASDLIILEAETVGLGAPYTSVADAANFARGGSVLRYTPANTLFNDTSSLTLTGLRSTARRLAFFAPVRNNSATTTFQIKLKVGFVQGASAFYTSAAQTPVTLIDASTTNTRMLFLGSIIVPDIMTPNRMVFSIAASAASGTIDIDYIVILAMDEEMDNAVMLSTEGIYPGTNAGAVTIDHRLLTSQSPMIYDLDLVDATKFPVSWQGDPSLVARDTTVCAIWLAVGLTDDWRVVSAGTPISMTFTANRNRAYLVPE